jgi:hypothetical protein
VPSLQPAPIDQVRTAVRFSLWSWAAYWPAMGLMLLLGGMRDPISVAVVVLSLGSFAILATMGALRTTSSRTMKEFLLERPFYLIAGVILAIGLGALVPTAAKLGLGVFSAVLLASLLLLGYRLVRYVDAQGVGVFRAKADQMFLLLLIVVPATLAVLYDAVVAGGLGNPPATVAAVNWIGLAYPALLLLASRPLREPLQLVRVKRAPKADGKPVPASAAVPSTK